MTYTLTTLPSGLRVASETLPGVESVAVAVSVGVGARYESEAENGISHLLEHMAFKGTKTRSARDIAESFDAIGGQLNAYTSMEATVYHAKVLKNDLPVALDILGDIVLRPAFAPDELAREQDVILQEIAMYRDMPDDLVSQYFDAAAFPAQPLGRAIVGTEERVSGFKRENLQHYMTAHYRAPRMVVSAAGNVKHEQLLELTQRHFDLEKTDAAPAPAPARYRGGDTRTKQDLEQLHLLMGLPGVSLHSPDYFAQQVYANILGGGMSSRLFQEVREKRGLAYGVSAGASAYDDCGVLAIYAATAPAKAAELSAVLCDELCAMAKHVSDEELARAKNQAKAELLMACESPQTVASHIGRHLLIFGEYHNVKAVTAKVNAVTKADVLRVAKNLLTGKLTLSALGDVKGVLPYEELAGRLG